MFVNVCCSGVKKQMQVNRVFTPESLYWRLSCVEDESHNLEAVGCYPLDKSVYTRTARHLYKYFLEYDFYCLSG